MKTKRNSLRLAPQNLHNYTITLALQGQMLNGFVGNISETGVMALIPQDQPLVKTIGVPVSGRIASQKDHIEFTYNGTIVWRRTEEVEHGDFISYGIHFETAFILPEPFYQLHLDPKSP